MSGNILDQLKHYPLKHYPLSIVHSILNGKVAAFRYITNKIIKTLSSCSITRIRNAYTNTLTSGQLTCPTELSFLNSNVQFLNQILPYYLCRIYRPKIVVETGVWTGKSSWYILSALKENQCGELYSIDIGLNQIGEEILPTKEIGGLVPLDLRDRWHLIIGDSYRELPSLLEELTTIDIFIHDSDHSKETQLFEYEVAYPNISHSGFLCSDDVNLSNAWDIFIQSRENPHYKIQDKIGILQKKKINSGSL